MAAKVAKVTNTKFIKVKVSNRNTEDERGSTWIGGNNVIIDGKPTIKHYRIELDKVVELPESFVDQLKARSTVVQGKNKTTKKIPLFVVEVI